MNAGLIAAALAAAAAAVFTVWLCTAGSESPESRGRRVPADTVHSSPTQHAAGYRKTGPDNPPGTGVTGGKPDGFDLRRATHQAAARTDSPVSPVLRSQHRRPDKIPVLPFAFREMPGDLHLEPAQVQAVEEVQDQFIESLGGEPADPATPEYRKKWLDTQRLADLQLRARIGGQAFAAYQRQRSMKVNAAAANENVPAP